MENASNALIIAGTILIALIILSMGVYLASTQTVVGEAYNEQQIQREIERYNTNFTSFENRNNITRQEIVTLAKFVSQYSKKNGIPEAEIFINSSKVNGVISGGKDTLPADFGLDKIVDDSPTVHTNSATFNYYKCETKDIVYENGRVVKIVFYPYTINKP